MHPHAPTDLDPNDISLVGDVVIVNYEGREQLAESLPVWNSMKEQGYVSTIHVVDNASSDGSVAYLEETYPEVNVIANETNTGFSSAVNQGMEEVTAETAFISTPDMVVTQSWCHKLLDALAEAPNRGAATGIVIRPSGAIDGRGSIENLFFRFNPASPRDDITPVDSGRGSALLVRSSAFDSAGGIDDDLFILWDEVSLTLNLREAGYETVFVPGALAWHCERLGYQTGLEYYHARNLYLLAGRHHDSWKFVRTVALNLGIHLIGHPISALLGRRRWAAVKRTWHGAAAGIGRAIAEQFLSKREYA